MKTTRDIPPRDQLRHPGSPPADSIGRPEPKSARPVPATSGAAPWPLRVGVTLAACVGVAVLTAGAMLPVATSSASRQNDRFSASTAAQDSTQETQAASDDEYPELTIDDLPPADQLPPETFSPGDEIVLVLDTGRRLRGELVVEEDWSWVIAVAGVRTTIRKEKVVGIRRIHPFEYYYDHLKATIPNNDYGRRLDFAEWIYRQKRYELATNEVELLLVANPNFEEARELLRRINISAEFEARRTGAQGGARGPGSRNPAAAANTSTPTNGLAGLRLLDRDEINLLRVYEVDLDNPPRMLADRDVIDLLLRDYGDSELIPTDPAERDRLYELDAVSVLELLFKLQARELYNKVRVIGDPEAFQRFRNDVHRAWVIRGCAAAECHGGPDAGTFILHRDRISSDRVAYTNFLIIDRYRMRSDDRPLIDVDHPELSPLLQMGLPPHWAQTPHPVASGWKPVFGSPEDPLYQASIAWIESLFAPRPSFPIEFTPPHVPTADEVNPAATGAPGGEGGGRGGPAATDR